MSELLSKLAKVLENRKDSDPSSSYVASLYTQGTESIIKKIGEEATEVVIAAMDDDRRAVVHEVADLWFHSIILLSHMDLSPDDVVRELEGRFGLSGIEKKKPDAINSTHP